MATVVALMVKERHIRLLLLQLMFYLVTDASMSISVPGLRRVQA
jgi:hypothetical protein